MNAVLCAGVTKSFGAVRALDGVDLEIAGSSLVALLGPSGCGKTTLLRVVAGFLKPDGGTVSVGGREVAGPRTDLPPERRKVGIVPQEQALFPHLTVAENVGYGLPRGPSRRERIAEMLYLTGLYSMGDRMPHELSGGQQQRVALARALAPRPSVVLLDEPFAGLDAALRVAMRAEVGDILRATGITALLVTHDQEEALSTAEFVAVMREGRICQTGTPDDVYNRPADLWVAGFVGDANVLDGDAVSGVVRCALGSLPCHGAGAGRVRVLIRPEQIEVVPSADGPAVVHSRQYFGHDALVRLKLDSGQDLIARTRSDPVASDGERVAVSCSGHVICYPAS